MFTMNNAMEFFFYSFLYALIFVNYFRVVQKQYMLFWLLKDA